MTELMTPKEVQQYLRISEPQLSRLIKTGDIPVTWVGGVRRFVPELIKKYAYGERGEK